MFCLMEGWLFLDALLSLKTNSDDLLVLGGRVCWMDGRR